MSTDRDVSRIVRSWLEEGVTTLPDRVLDDVLDRVPATPQRRSWWPARRFAQMNNVARIAIAAAAVVVVAIAGYNLLPRSSSSVGSDPTATASPSLAPSPTLEPTPAETTRVHDGPGALEPGRWAMDVGSIRVSFEVPFGWQENAVPDMIWQQNSNGRFGFGLVDNLYTGPCDSSALMEPPLGPAVDDLAAALVSLPGIEATGPTDIVMGGFDGKLVEFDLAEADSPCEQGIVLWPIPSISEPAPLETSARTRVWIVDVAGSRLVVTAVERTALGPTHRTQLQQIIDSIVIQPQ